MRSLRSLLGAGLVLLLISSLSLQSTSASELSDAESRLDQLRQSLEADTHLINVTLRGYELEAFNCVQRYQGDTTPESIALKNDCQTALDRTQADIFSVTRRAAATQNEMTTLRNLIEKLRAPVTPEPSPSPSSSSPSSTVSQIAEMPTSGSARLPDPKLSPEVKQSEIPNAADANEAIAPISGKPSITQLPEPKVLKSPKAQPGASSQSKSKVSVRTIICTKGLKTKKVSGINPKCPSGFKRK